MKVIFKTNIDAYSDKHYFPEHFTAVPRKGEMVEVKNEYIKLFTSKKLPSRLEVVSVTWKERNPFNGHSYETYVEVELWYNETDLKFAKLAGGKPL